MQPEASGMPGPLLGNPGTTEVESQFDGGDRHGGAVTTFSLL